MEEPQSSAGPASMLRRSLRMRRYYNGYDGYDGYPERRSLPSLFPRPPSQQPVANEQESGSEHLSYPSYPSYPFRTSSPLSRKSSARSSRTAIAWGTSGCR